MLIYRIVPRVLVVLILSLALLQAGTGPVQSAPTQPEAPAACGVGCATINGSPLVIQVGADTSYQVYYRAGSSSFRQVYSPLFDEGDSGLVVRYNNYVIGPDFLSHLASAANLYDPWSGIDQSAVTGSGSLTSPWVVETNVNHTTSGVSLRSKTSYVNGSNSFQIDWEVCLPQAGTVSTYLAADYYLQGGDADPSQGVYDRGTVGSVSQSGAWLQAFTPVTPGSRYFAGQASSLWSAIGKAGAPGTGFNNTINSSATDGGAGLQWDLTISKCATVSATWQVAGDVPGNSPTPAISVYLPNVFQQNFFTR